MNDDSKTTGAGKRGNGVTLVYERLGQDRPKLALLYATPEQLEELAARMIRMAAPIRNTKKKD